MDPNLFYMWTTASWIYCSDNFIIIQSMNVIKKLYVSLVHPHLEYADSIWHSYSAKNCDIVESVQRFAGRVCLNCWDIGY